MPLFNLKLLWKDKSLNKVAMDKLGFNDRLEWSQPHGYGLRSIKT